ncbi:HAD family hydrolase [bacterium]|nr:HAD family hydrolase [bacterium]
MNIAMWSGPRNLSTAMMRSFGNRADCVVWDEPFYAAYLAETGLDHPMRAEVLAAGETDWRKVAERCVGPGPGEKAIFYQKHMTHHMVPAFERDWIDKVTNAFLIRAPERVLASYAAKREDPTLADIGFVAQAELFARAADRLGHAPPVLDAEDVRGFPKSSLKLLCEALRIPFDPAMLSWAPGPRPEDGAWAPHWYDGLWRSTGFAPPEDGPPPDLPPALARLADAARPHYDALRRHRLRPETGEGA